MEAYKRGSHTVWDCKYHLIWVTNYRYAALGGDVGARCRELLRETAWAHEMVVHAGSINRDHVHRWEAELLGASALIGVVAGPGNAMRSTPVRRAVQSIAESIGQLPSYTHRHSYGFCECDREPPAAGNTSDNQRMMRNAAIRSCVGPVR